MNSGKKITSFLLFAVIAVYAGSAQIPESAIVIGRENSDYLSIQAAIDDPRVFPGSLLYLVDDIYTEQDILIDKDLTIMGSDYHSTVVQAADEPGKASGRVFEIKEDTHVTLRNITIRHGNAAQCPKTGGGIYTAGSLIIENCLITENRSSSGGGITMKNGSLIIENSIISQNTAHGDSEVDNMHGSGGGIKGGEGDIQIYNSVIEYNSANKRGGGIKLGCLCTMTLDSSLIRGNIAIGDGGGVNIKGRAVISNTTITGNRAKTSGGLYNDGTLTISDSRITDNKVNLKSGCAGLLNTTDGIILSITDCEIDEMRGHSF